MVKLTIENMISIELDDSICDRLRKYEKDFWRGKNQNVPDSYTTLINTIFDKYLSDSGLPLHTIKKVRMVEDRYGMKVGAQSTVNQLLSKGWVLLAVITKEVGPKTQHIIFTLGHTDASADDTVEVKYPEDL